MYARILPRVKTFELINRKKLWGEHESVSGVGSTLQATRGVREALPIICKELSISTLVDIPCGDFAWMAEFELPIQIYVGGDIVRELIESNRERLHADSRDFIVIDIVEDPLPKGDLILVRDCLLNLPNDDVEKCLQNIVSSNIRYLLSTQYSCLEHNVPCRVGDWRPINLRRAPFNFPKPERLMPDVDFPGKPLRKEKQLALRDLNKIRGV